MSSAIAAGCPSRPPSYRYLEAGGLSTRHLDVGEGPPLLLMPSGFLRARTYRSNVRSLARRFRVLVPEMPGSGGSAGLRSTWGFEGYADWTPRFLDALGLRRALIVGHSDSGGVGLVLAARHPGRLDGLVLVDPVGAFPGASWWRLFRGRLRDAVTWEPLLSVRLAAPILANLAAHPRSFLRHVRLAAEITPLEVAPRIPVPTLLTWGRHDHTLPPHCAERLHAALPDSRLRWVEASHDWLFQRPDELTRAVVGFARELGLLD